MKQWQKYVAELLGTFILVFGGSLALVSAAANNISVGFGFGLALLAGLYAFGEISGGHFNPIVSLAMFLDRRLTALETIWYWISQFVGAICASLVILATFASTKTVGQTANFSGDDARNFVLEIVLSAILVAVVLQVTRTAKYGATALIAYPLTYSALYFGPAIGAILGWVAHMVTVRGDTTLTDDLVRAATDMRGVEMGDVRQGPGQVPPPEAPPASTPGP